MKCSNKVSFYVQHKVSFYVQHHEVYCGNTDPWGSTAICDSCRNDPDEMRRNRLHEEDMYGYCGEV